MISYDPKKLVVKHLHVKMISGALGGMLTYVDEARTKTAGKEVVTKTKVPYHLTRHFAKKYRITKYIKPVLTAVTFYEDHIVCIERHPLGNLGKEVTEGLFGEKHWQSDSAINTEKFLNPLTTGQNWYIDGSYVYCVSDKDLKSAESLSSDGKFRQVKVNAIKLAGLADKPTIEQRVCLAFYPTKGEMALTPPIWKTLTNIGQRQLTARGDTRNDDEIENDSSVTYIHQAADRTQFDCVDDHLCVNLGFVLKAGKVISDTFGYDSIEPLGLDDMMIQLKTVNLPNVAREVKQTFDTGLKFTIACAWLIGMTRRIESLDGYIALRTLLKHLTTKGVYRKGAFEPESIFKSGASLSDVKRLSLEEAKQQTKTLTLDDFLRASRLAKESDVGDNTPLADMIPPDLEAFGVAA
jgi:hypothetical protein